MNTDIARHTGPHVSDGFYTRRPGPVPTPTHTRPRMSGTDNLLVPGILRTGVAIRNQVPPKPWTPPTHEVACALVRDWVVNRGYVLDGAETTAHPELVKYCDPKIILDLLTHLVLQYTPRPKKKQPAGYETDDLQLDIFVAIARGIIAEFQTPVMTALVQRLTSAFGSEYLSEFWKYSSLKLKVSPKMISNSILAPSLSKTSSDVVSPTVRGRTPHGNTLAQPLFGQSAPKELTENKMGVWHSSTDPSVEFTLQGTGTTTDGKRISPLERALMVMLIELTRSGHPAGIAGTEFLASLGTSERPILTASSRGQVIYNPNEIIDQLFAQNADDSASEGSGNFE